MCGSGSVEPHGTDPQTQAVGPGWPSGSAVARRRPAVKRRPPGRRQWGRLQLGLLQLGRRPAQRLALGPPQAQAPRRQVPPEPGRRRPERRAQRRQPGRALALHASGGRLLVAPVGRGRSRSPVGARRALRATDRLRAQLGEMTAKPPVAAHQILGAAQRPTGRLDCRPAPSADARAWSRRPPSLSGRG